jgi:hypothetical protein
MGRPLSSPTACAIRRDARRSTRAHRIGRGCGSLLPDRQPKFYPNTHIKLLILTKVGLQRAPHAGRARVRGLDADAGAQILYPPECGWH